MWIRKTDRDRLVERRNSRLLRLSPLAPFGVAAIFLVAMASQTPVTLRNLAIGVVVAALLSYVLQLLFGEKGLSVAATFFSGGLHAGATDDDFDVCVTCSHLQLRSGPCCEKCGAPVGRLVDYKWEKGSKPKKEKRA